MPAMAVINPTIFSQAVNHAQVGPPSSADQWYIPPEVGKAEHSSAMLRVTSRVPAVASGQPSVISSGPPMVKPYPNRVNAPVRMRSEEHTSELQSRLHLVC